jgi:glutamine phosphoribosylpyrophosphate amidotransferase
MCGIAGYSIAPGSTLDPLYSARVLIASVAERGSDAAGCAYADGAEVVVHKQHGGASRFLDALAIPEHVRHALLHVRDFTKGRPSLMANNHPIRHGSVIGVHNGKITNDEQVFRRLGTDRAEPGMTVDSEAIFAALHHGNDMVMALEQLRGSLACGWFDAADPHRVFLARGYGRPLWIGRAIDCTAVLWASTLEALEIAEDLLAIALHKRPLRPGSIIEVSDGDVSATHRFNPDARATWLANPVASPAERVACLQQLGRTA